MELPFINARPLHDFLSTKNEPGPVGEKALVTFVLGSGSMGPVRKAAELYRNGLTGYIAFTSAGGNFGGNIVFGREEVDAYRDTLIALGVHSENVLFPQSDELRTTNTLAEARGAIPFINSKRVGGANRMILCSRSVHQRRAWATFRKQHPDVYYVNCPDHEELTVELLPRLVQEIDRLREYGAKGDLEVQEIPEDVSEICEQIRKHLGMK